MEPLRHVANLQFGAVFLRRRLGQVRNEGGLWDESEKLYPSLWRRIGPGRFHRGVRVLRPP